VSGPAKPIRPVRVDAAAAEAAVEANRPSRPELREARLVPPAGEEVAVRQPLEIALVDGHEGRRVNEAPHDPRLHVLEVQMQDKAA
jgi:hypothetical protein